MIQQTEGPKELHDALVPLNKTMRHVADEEVTSLIGGIAMGRLNDLLPPSNPNATVSPNLFVDSLEAALQDGLRPDPEKEFDAARLALKMPMVATYSCLPLRHVACGLLLM